MTQYARARTWLASAKDDWLLPLTKQATEELIAEHDELMAALDELLDASIAVAPMTLPPTPAEEYYARASKRARALLPPTTYKMFYRISCSQCGNEFGPGYHGFSACSEHRELRPLD